MVQADVTFALGIPHTPWIPARVASLERLRGSLDLIHDFRIFADRAPNHVWSAQMWHWAAETGTTHFLQLQDDVIVTPQFWKVLRAMVSAVPDQLIGLESVLEYPGPWYTTSDGLIGVGYVFPMLPLREFLEWRAHALCKGAVESIDEDTLIDVWCVAIGRRIWHPVPTIIDHDTDIKSTYGHEHHSHRRPKVTWKDRSTDVDWTPGDVLHAGHFYGGNVARLARRWVKGATDADWERWKTC